MTINIINVVSLNHKPNRIGAIKMTIYGILAEKKDAATYMAEALGTITQKDLKNGYIEINQSILGGKAVITWPDGHVVGLANMASYGDQYAKWDLDNLPFLPTHYRFEVAKEGYKQKKFNNVKAALQTVDEIIIATDADREGENIAYSILIKAGLKAKIKWRLWYNSLQKSEFQRAFKNLLPASKTYPYFVEAQTRQIADWNVGINLTQAYTLHLQQAHLKGTYTAGRVQSPVLAEVVRNDLAIKSFKPIPFYQLKGNHQVDHQQVIEFKHDQKFDTKDALMHLLAENNISEGVQSFQVKEIKTELKHKIAPKLFDLAGIQSYANSHWKFALDKTLSLVQSLYEKKLVSYPRTACEFITTGDFNTLKTNLSQLAPIVGIESSEMTNQLPRLQYVNDQKVQEHYALIPLKQAKIDLTQLSDDENKVYKAIVQRTLMMFMADYDYETTKVTLNNKQVALAQSGITPVNQGWHRFMNSDKQEVIVLPSYQQGQSVELTLRIEEGFTKPPQRLTPASLGGKNSLMERLGLGTPATRSNIVEGLIKRDYLTEKKNQLFPTEKGRLFYDLIKDDLLGSPEMTANWEKALSKISEQSMTQERFLEQNRSYIKSAVAKIKSQTISNKQVTAVSHENELEIGPCPKCQQGKVVLKSKLAKCDNTGCDFIVWPTIAKKKLTTNQIKILITKGKTGLIKGFTSKKGSKFDARLKLDADYHVTFDFDNKA